jgi:excisionase family DNA binding protein
MKPAANEGASLLTAKEVASRWSICTKTVRRLADRGLLRPVRISARCVRFSASDVAGALTKMSGETARMA